MTAKTVQYFDPVTIPMSSNETLDEFHYRWRKFDELSEEAKNKISNQEIPVVLETIQKNFKLELSQIANVTRAVRAYYFGDLKIEELPLYVSHRSSISDDLANKISQIIVERIILSKKTASIGQAVKAQNLLFSEALKQFSQLGEQTVSQNPIKLKYFENPVRASIKNWITDYQQVVGIDRRDAMKRGSYIFQGENAKRLTMEEKEKLAFVLKALDEDLEVNIDPISQQIIFPKVPAQERPVRQAPSLEINRSYFQQGPERIASPLPPREQRTMLSRPAFAFDHETPVNVGKKEFKVSGAETPKQNFENIHFSSSQQLPAERQNTATQRIKPAAPGYSGAFRISPVNRRYEGVEHHDGEPKNTQRTNPGISGNTVNLRGNK